MSILIIWASKDFPTNAQSISLNINSENAYFTALDQGELSGKSDHFPFAEAGVPAIFFMMKGDAFKVCHTSKDNIDNIYLDNFPRLFKLITEFVETY